MKLKIGIIGYRNHALRLMNVVLQNEFCELKYVYHPNKPIDHPCATNKIGDLYLCDAVIIASPNQTHFFYIEKLLENFNGYIFCEKPPVVVMADLENLAKVSDADKNRLYFNYNFRFSFLSEILKNFDYLKKIGKIHHIKIINTHGLAFKKEYINSWRSDGKENLRAITETVAIHYLDLLISFFGEINSYSYSPDIVAKTGTAYDTVHLSLNFNQLTASIYASYAGPYINEILIIGTDGFLRIQEDKVTLFYPRDTFNDDGFFKVPPLAKEYTIDSKKEYENSLKKSFEFFIEHVYKGSKINTKQFEASLSANKFLLEIQAKK